VRQRTNRRLVNILRGNDLNIIACISLYCLAKLNLDSRSNLVMLPFQATGNTMELVLIKESIWAYISIVTSQEKVSRTSSVFEYIPYPYSTSIDKTEAKTCDVGRATERQNFFSRPWHEREVKLNILKESGIHNQTLQKFRRLLRHVQMYISTGSNSGYQIKHESFIRFHGLSRLVTNSKLTQRIR
jgi:hypothetical protein